MSNWMTSLMEQGGYPAIAFLMFLENVFPPIPSEVVMPLAGYQAQRGDLNVFLVVVAGSLGALAGATFWFVVARWFGMKGLKTFASRHGRWLTLSPSEIDDADAWFDEHGHKAVFFGRLVPGVRSLISVPAGITGMSTTRFLIYTTAGTTLWTALLTGAGWMLGANYSQISTWLGPMSNVVVAGIAVWYVWRVATFSPGEGQESS